MSDIRHIILNGEIVKEKEATVSPINRGMMYGDGCFETLRYYAGSFLGWDRHWQRLKDGLDYLGINPAFTNDGLKEQVLALIEVDQLSGKEAMIRVQCWREGSRGYATDSSKIAWMIQASGLTPDTSPLKLAVAETRCIPSKALDRKYKLSNGLNYIRAAQEAREKQCDDSLMLTIDDKVSETTSANIFWVKDDTIYTPSTDCDLLPGITRLLILEVAGSLGIQIREGKFELSDIRRAEALFCTNSLIEIRQVLSIDDDIFEIDHPLVKKIKAGFEQHKEQEWTK